MVVYNESMQDFRNLRVYQNAYSLAVAVYSATQQLPRSELFGLVPQMRRAAVSIASNIAEGSARGGPDFARFLRIALGSGFELETQLRLCNDLSLADQGEFDPLIESVSRIQRQLGSLIRSIGRPLPDRTKPRTVNQQPKTGS